MSQPRTFSNEQLTAYLDGEADTSLVEALERGLATDADLRDRLSRLDIETAAMKSAFEGVLAKAPAFPAAAEALLPKKTGRGMPRPRPAPWRTVAATAVVCFSLGWLAATLSTRARIETWQHYAATYHAMYVTGTLTHVDVSAAVSSRDLQRVSDALGLAVHPSVVTGIDQLSFKRAQMLGFDGRPVAQLAFLSRSGAPLALCIARIAEARASAVRTDTVLGMAAATWSKGGYEFLLIGGTDAALIATSAGVLAQAL